MTFRIVGAAAFALLLASSAVATAQDLASQMVGVWKKTSHIEKVLATNETSKPQGENPGGMVTYSKGGHFMWIYAADGRKPSEKQPPTDADRVYMSKTSSFGAGSYKVGDNNKIAATYAVGSNQSWVGTERSWTVQVSGKVLTTTSGSFKNNEGKDVVAIATFERLE